MEWGFEVAILVLKYPPFTMSVRLLDYWSISLQISSREQNRAARLQMAAVRRGSTELSWDEARSTERQVRTGQTSAELQIRSGSRHRGE